MKEIDKFKDVLITQCRPLKLHLTVCLC